jgi:imidazolonepropionase-like amidohydrolase
VPEGFASPQSAIDFLTPFWLFENEKLMRPDMASGLTPMQALVCATRNSARAIGLSDRGTLEPGKLADFVILGGDPLSDIENTEKVVGVWHRGKKVAGRVVEAGH